MNGSPAFNKPSRGTPKAVRLNAVQRQIMKRLQQIEHCDNASDVILRALDMYACAVLDRTNDQKLKELLF